MISVHEKHKPLILIVDDNLKNIQVLGSILTHNHYDLLIARSGFEAIEKVRNRLPDLILLDVMMPEMDGYQTCEKLKKLPGTKEIPIIFLTAKTEENDVIKGFQTGAVDYVTKPFRAAELLARIKTHIELKLNREKVKWQSRERKELLHILCHDLANPISSILSIIELVKDKPELLGQYIEMMEISLFNSLDIIKLVRQLRSLEEGKIKLELTSVPVYDAIKSSFHILTHLFEKKNIEIVFDIPDNLFVLVDETSFINTVINNLLTNAEKFSYRDSKIVIHAEEFNEVKVLITIQDNGIGIPPKILDNLFDISKATSRNGTEDELGTGFGMPLVKKFVDYYDGIIEVESKDKKRFPDDHGTLVKLYLKKARPC